MALEIKKVTLFRAPELPAIANFAMAPLTLILQDVFTNLICVYWRMEKNMTSNLI